MAIYIVRTDAKVFVGIVIADNPTQLVITVDENCDPTCCEYREIEPTSGFAIFFDMDDLGHISDGLIHLSEDLMSTIEREQPKPWRKLSTLLSLATSKK